jgi:RHS repeat-associated protein
MLRTNSFIASLLQISALSALLLYALLAVGQTASTELNTGYPENAIFHGSDIDNVQINNGNLHISIPVWSVKGRGLDTSFGFVYNNKGWTFNTHCNTTYGICSDAVTPEPGDTMSLTALGPLDYQFSWKSSSVQCATVWTVQSSNYVLREPDGTKHHFGPDPVADISNACAPVMSTLYADDGSGWIMQINPSGGILYAVNKKGTKVVPSSSGYASSATSVTDSNGNQLRATQASPGGGMGGVDTLGRTFSGDGSYYDSTNVLRAVTIQYTTVQSLTQECQFSEADTCLEAGNGQGGVGTWTVPQVITLPNGMTYTFGYNNSYSPATGGGGEPTSMTLPTGGTVTWSWGSWDHGGRRVSSRTVSANGVSGTWNYAYNTQGPTVTVTDPAQKDTKYFCSQGNDLWDCKLVTKVQYFDGSASAGQLIKTVQTDYQNYFFGPGNSEMSLPIRETTTWNQQNLVSKVETDPDTFAINYTINNQPRSFTFSWQNPLERREYDWGSGASGALSRRTHFSYKHLEQQAYLNANIADRVTLEKIYDSSNDSCKGLSQPCAQTTFAYDVSGLTNTNSSGDCQNPSVVGHDYCAYPYTNLTRGNVTTVGKWLNTTGGTLNTTNTYDDLGNLLSTTDPGQHITNFSYSDNWGGSGCVSAANTYGYPTQISNALLHRTKTSYYQCTGLTQSKKDENDIQANRSGMTYTYDKMNRVLVEQAKDQNQNTIAQTSFSYNDATLYTVSKTISASPNPDITTSTVYDGMGRVSKTRIDSDPEGVDFVDITYDNIGRKHSESNTQRINTTSSTDGTTQYAYDAIGRIQSLTRQDGGTVGTDYSSTISYGSSQVAPAVIVTDETGRKRRSGTDGLGRLVEVDEADAPYAGSAAQGILTIGSLQSTVVQTQYATQASGTVTIWGEVQSRYDRYDCACWIVDFGDVWISVAGSPQLSTGYSTVLDTPERVSNELSYLINTSGVPVTATSSRIALDEAIVTITATQYGAVGNDYGMSAGTDWDRDNFNNSSFYALPSGPSLTGGQDDAYATVYDSGTITATVGGFTTSPPINYDSSTSASYIAQQLASKLNVPASPVTATYTGGSSILLTYKSAGSAANGTAAYTSAASNQPGYFPNGSFNGNTTLNNGSDPNAFSNAYKTLYAYDVLGNLLCVEQRGNVTGTGCSSDPSQDASSPWRVRRFTYDSLSRLLSAKNPESGTVSYSYNDDSVLISKTDARGITINYNPSDSPIDALHRVTKETYSNADPSVSYFYDQTSYNGLTIANGVGRRTGMTDASGQTAWSYDAMGRTTDEKRTIGTAPPKTISYQYDLAGSLKQLTYPDNEVVTFANNAAGRPLSAIDSTLNINFAKNAAYAPTGALSSLQIGSTATFFGVFACNQYNKRLQPTNIGAFLLSSCPTDFTTPTAGQTVMNLNYDFGLGAADNGNVLSITNRKDTTRSTVFVYDPLNRLTSAQTNSNRWGNTYDYDAWGNLVHKNQVSGKTSGEFFQQSANGNNRIAGYCHDAGGNLTNQGACGTATYAYDAENRISSTGGVTYTYDGDGKRVQKSNGTLYWGDGPLAESDLNGNFLRNFIFFGGKRIARKDGSGNVVHYYFADNLGTADVVTSAIGTIENESDYYPWGGEQVITSTLANQNYKFTGKERDSESGLDYFGARFYANQMGRWMSPDWAAKPTAVPYAEFGDPQSLNLYGYVRNNPMSTADADGHCGPVCVIIESVVESPVGQQVESWGIHLAAGAGVLLSAAASNSGQNAYPSYYHGEFQNPDGTNTLMRSGQSGNSSEQGRDAQGKFLPKQPGQTQPGADAEKKGLDAVGATKNTKPLPNGRVPDGDMPDGQKVEVKSGSSINNTGQVKEMAEGAKDATGKPLVVVVTNPNAKVSGPVNRNPNIEVKRLEK